jgi:GntR family transcriptional regulator
MGQPDEPLTGGVMQRIVRSSFKPIYLQIGDLLREEIVSGRLPSGSRVPSEREIMEEYGVSRNTAQSAIDELVRLGLVSRIQGKGTFVNDFKVRYGLHNLTSFSEEIRLRGKMPSSKVIDFSKEQVEAIIANKLGIQAGDWVFRLERLRFADDKPMMHEVSYVPCSLFPELDQHDFSRESLFKLIEDHYHLMISHQEQVIRPIISSEQEASILGVEVGMPLIATEGITYLDDGTVVEANQLIYRSDLYELSVVSTRR